jgi:hypothetical protein
VKRRRYVGLLWYDARIGRNQLRTLRQAIGSRRELESGVFYEPCSARDDLFVIPDIDWEREHQPALFCSGCARVRNVIFPQPIDVRLRQLPADTVISSVFPTGVGVIHQEFLRVLRPHMPRFAIGRCFDVAGAALPDYATYYTPDLTVERTDEGRYHECPDCGSIRTAGDSVGFVTEDTINGRQVLQWFTTALLVDPELVKQVDRSRLPPFRLIGIPVLPPLPVGYRSPYERATELLKAAFDGDLCAAHAAVEAEARSIRMPNGVRTMGIVVRGIELWVKGHVDCGIMRVESFRVP